MINGALEELERMVREDEELDRLRAIEAEDQDFADSIPGVGTLTGPSEGPHDLRDIGVLNPMPMTGFVDPMSMSVPIALKPIQPDDPIQFLRDSGVLPASFGAQKPIQPPSPDPVNHPAHYTSHPSGVEAITVCEHYGFNVGNAIKYLWRAGLKTSDATEDLRKSIWYIDREVKRLEKAGAK